MVVLASSGPTYEAIGTVEDFFARPDRKQVVPTPQLRTASTTAADDIKRQRLIAEGFVTQALLLLRDPKHENGGLQIYRPPMSVFGRKADGWTLSLPKIRSVWIRSMSQNHRIIQADVCDPARALDLSCRHFQVATQAGSREPVSSSSA
jgi:hypothetical protein